MSTKKIRTSKAAAAAPSDTTTVGKAVPMTIPLARLSPKPAAANVRTSPRIGLEELAASILSVGLMYPLVVIQSASGGYRVAAGGRRFEALRLLAKAKKIPADWPVACLLVEEADARIYSLTENVQRQAMHPADEFDAFAKLIAEGRSVEHIAAIFGLAPVVVQRRLRLARISPRLVADFRAGSVDLDQLMALAIIEDHEAQETAYYSASEWNRSPRDLRARLTKEDVPATDPRAVFIGEAAYRAAGGGIRQDLFAEQGHRPQWTDPDILDALVRHRLDAAAEEVGREGWGWVEIRTAPIGYGDLSRYGDLPSTYRQPTAEEAAALRALNAESDRLQAAFENAEDLPEDDEGREAKLDALDGELDDCRDRIASLREQLRAVRPELHALAGAIVAIDHHGKLDIRRGQVRPEDRKAVAEASREPDEDDAEDDTASPGAEPAESSGMSMALGHLLSAHRTMALQLEVATQPRVAIALLAFALSVEVLDSPPHYIPTAIKIRMPAPVRLEGIDAAIGATESRKRFVADGVAWRSVLPRSPQERLDHLLAMPIEDLHALLAYCTGISIDALLPRPESTDRAAAVAGAVDLDMRKHWQATASGYFNHIKRDAILTAVDEFAPGNRSRLSKLKKAALASEAERLAQGTGWLPPIFRRQPRRQEATTFTPAHDAPMVVVVDREQQEPGESEAADDGHPDVIEDEPVAA
ncbi:MAG: ParB/RepB/Spo0J family partition protein [Lautropia sp.]